MGAPNCRDGDSQGAEYLGGPGRGAGTPVPQEVLSEGQALFQGLILQGETLNPLLGVCRPLEKREALWGHLKDLVSLLSPPGAPAGSLTTPRRSLPSASSCSSSCCLSSSSWEWKGVQSGAPPSSPPPTPCTSWAPHLPKDKLFQPLPSPLVLLQLGRLLPLGLASQ